MPPRRAILPRRSAAAGAQPEQLASAVAESRSMREVPIALGLAPRGGNYETVWRRIEAIAVNGAHLRRRFRRGRSVRSLSDQEVMEAVSTSRYLAQVWSSSDEAWRQPVSTEETDQGSGSRMSHFTGQGWRLGYAQAAVPAKPIEQVLVKGRLTNTGALRRRLIQERLKEARCEMRLGQVEW
jgi:hypothetical protein